MCDSAHCINQEKRDTAVDKAAAVAVFHLSDGVVLQQPACVGHLQEVSVFHSLSLSQTQVLNHDCI